MKQIYLFFLLHVFCVPCLADVADPPVATTDESAPVYYLIQNWKTKEYYLDDGSSDRLWSVNGITNSSSLTTSHDVDDYLFYFVSSGSGYKIGCKTAGARKYLDKTNLFSDNLRGSHVVSSTHETGFTSTGTTWQIAKCQYNNVGVEISDGAGKYWGADRAGSYYYIDMEATADIDEQVWVLWSFADLVEEAKRHNVTGIDYESLDPQQGDSFKTLVDAIKAKQTTAYVNDFIANFEDGDYLIRNRLYGTYLNTNGNGMTPTTAPTQYSVWHITRSEGKLTITGAGNKPIRVANSGTANTQWTLNTSNDVWQPDFVHSTDNNNRYIAFTGIDYGSGLSTNTYYFGMGKTAAERKTEAKPSVDWELIPINNGTYEHNGDTHMVETSITSENELVATNISQSLIVRLRNVTRSVVDPATDVFDGGGYLEDVDHVHFTYRKEEDPATKAKNDDPEKAFLWDKTEAELMHSARTAEFYAAKPSRSHPSALWQLQCIANAATSHDAATGHILPEHNIFVLRNLNTGCYVKSTNAVQQDGKIYPVTTTNEHEAAKFFLVKLMDGQYAFYVYHGTDTGGHDLEDGGSIYIDGQSDGYMGSLCYQNGLHPTMNTNAAWIVSPAPTLELPLLVTGLSAESGKNFDRYDWTTFYFPFDVVPAPQTGQEVTIFQGKWIGQYTYGSGKKGGTINMTAVANVPAGNAAFVRSSKNAGMGFDNVIFNVYPAGSGQTTQPDEDFVSNVWRGIIESDDSVYWGSTEGWRDYWVLTKNAAGNLRLLHPSGSYLLPNRAYIDAETVQAVNGGKVTAFNLLQDDNITGITDLHQSTRTDSNVWYTLEGQRLQSKPTAKGLYIHNGKKVIVK